ncbi:MAG: hypothetical protein H6741_30990 [Alphaproteobacteria bacterium]|nr:hypothetical protein [Alphaproteobacteria bacterium]
MPVSVTETFFSAPTDPWDAFTEAVAELGLEVREGLHAADPERERAGCHAHGWVRLPDPWGLEAPLLKRVARGLGEPVELVHLRASASLGASTASYTLECTRARRLGPDGQQSELRAAILKHPFTFDDAGAVGHSDPETLREALDEFLSETAWDTLSEIRSAEQETRYFLLCRPDAWEPPARFALALADGEAGGARRASLQVGDTRHVLPAETLGWLSWTLQESGLLDRSVPEPDLARWTPRLLRRLGLEAEPGPTHPQRAEWEADWARLTRRERGATVAGGKRIPAWKLERPGAWELDAVELDRLRDVAARSHPREHMGHAELWLRALRGAQRATLRLE